MSNVDLKDWKSRGWRSSHEWCGEGWEKTSGGDTEEEAETKPEAMVVDDRAEKKINAEDDEWRGKDWTRRSWNDWSGEDGTSASGPDLEQRTENEVDGKEAEKQVDDKAQGWLFG